MENDYISLSYWQIALAACLVVANGILSLALGLNLERRLAITSVRMVIQLLLVGLVLHWVFAINRWYVVLLVAAAMTVVAGFAAVGRIERPFPGLFATSILSMWASSWLVAGIGILAVVQVQPWYNPQYAIPLLGMILGNTLSGISLSLERFTSQVDARRDEIETLLALGATRWEAGRGAARDAVRTGLIPTLNAMSVAGIVSLPGMMTGQLLSGIDPVEAVKYQVVIMFFIAAGTMLGSVSAVLLSFRQLLNGRHQLVR